MSAVEDIERAVQGLSAEQLAAFRAWFAEFDAAVWDRQLEADCGAGRLDARIEEALGDLRQALHRIVRHLATRRFWECYHALPSEIRELADRCYSLLRNNPRHPSLLYRNLGRVWSVRVGLHYRALAVEQGADMIWFWIGSHAEYDQLVGRAYQATFSRLPRNSSPPTPRRWEPDWTPTEVRCKYVSTDPVSVGRRLDAMPIQ